MIKGRLFFLLLSFFVSTFAMVAQEELPKEMVNAFKKGEAESLKPYLADKVQFIVERKVSEPLIQKEAVVYLKEFFEQNRPSDFSILHKSIRENTGFFIAKLTTAERKLRLYCLFTATGEQLEINRMRIDRFIG